MNLKMQITKMNKNGEPEYRKRGRLGKNERYGATVWREDRGKEESLYHNGNGVEIKAWRVWGFDSREAARQWARELMSVLNTYGELPPELSEEEINKRVESIISGG